MKSGDIVAYFSVMILFPLFNHVLYHPFNALHGIFYSWDVGWFCLALYLFIRGIEASELSQTAGLVSGGFIDCFGNPRVRRFDFGSCLCLLFGLPYSIPETKSMDFGNGNSVRPILLIVIIQILEPHGQDFFKSGPPFLERIIDRFSLIARIVIVPHVAPLLIGGVLQTTAHFMSKQRPASSLWAIASGVVTFGMISLFPAIAQPLLLFLLIVLSIVITWKISEFRIFSLLGLLGIMHYFLVKGGSRYLRFLIFGITPIMVFGLVKAGESLLLRFKLPLPSAKSQSKWIIGLTVLVLISIGLGLLDVPGFRSPVQNPIFGAPESDLSQHPV